MTFELLKGISRFRDVIWTIEEHGEFDTGQTTVNKKNADLLYDLYKWYGPQTFLKMF